MKLKIFFFILILSTIYHLRSITSLAQTFDSPNFHIEFGNFNMTGGRKTSTTYTLTDSVGQIAPGQYDNTGYTVKAGFQYIYDKNIPFSFEISNLDLNFGPLVPNIGSTITNILTISTPTAHGYDILALANHPLKSIGSNSTIPDTKCNAGLNCDESQSKIWNENNAYGFGFNANGDGTSSFFTDSTYFRQFADNSLNETAKILMSESLPVENHTATITYKVNISPNQAAGTYQNSINFIAIPKY
jgi:hypothetical protein